MLLEKQDIPIVAMDFMNTVHYEEIEMINALFALLLAYEREPNRDNKIALIDKYKAWTEHTISHFQGEEVKMRELNFPPYLAHKGEHDKELARMQEVFDQWQKSDDIKILKAYCIEELPTWLIQHIQSMDTITAIFFQTGQSPCAIH